MSSRPRSSYVELAPPECLAPYVACLWVQRIGEGDVDYEQPVLPDGSIDLVSVGDAVMLAGPATRPVTVRLPPGALTAGVRFRPGAAPPLIGVSAADLRDLDVPARELWGRHGDTIVERSALAAGPAGRLGVLTAAVTARVAEARPVDPVVAGIAAALAHRPDVPLPLLAADVALSERHLRRRVEAAVGYPPRTLARILRFQRFLHAARAAPPGRRGLARLAAENGYADQAHLTRESRRLGGLPPAALLDAEARRLSGDATRRVVS